MSGFCVLCGIGIIPVYGEVSWESIYRAGMLYSGSQYRNGQPIIWTVYSAEDGEARLSGVGLRSAETGYIYTVPVKETGRWHDARCSFISTCVWHSRRGNGAFSGVFFHEACWALLEECLLGKPVPLEQLLDVFQSRFFTHGSRSRWSLFLEDEYNDSLDYKNRTRDPYHVPKIQEILNSPSTFPPRIRKKSRNHQACNKDCFLRLQPRWSKE